MPKCILTCAADGVDRQIVARILFIYAKLNPGQGYVQGMNEIIGPLYYVFANDPKDNWNGRCFEAVMKEFVVIRLLITNYLFRSYRSGHFLVLYQFDE